MALLQKWSMILRSLLIVAIPQYLSHTYTQMYILFTKIDFARIREKKKHKKSRVLNVFMGIVLWYATHKQIAPLVYTDCLES